jgi:LCP family protein required for cell wall assembly
MTELSRSRSVRTVRKSQRAKKIKLILLGIFILLLAGGVFAYIKFESFLDQITTNQEPTVEGEETAQDQEYSEDPFAMVILGKDTRDGESGLKNTDVMIVAVVQPKEKKVKLLSIPRDTRVMIPGYTKYHKINSAYSRGENARLKAERNNEPVTVTGISLVKKTLEGLLGIPIKHYVTVDFEGFKAVIDELGGIEVNVERRLVYHDPTDGTSIDLEPGLQVLDGQKALDYVRHRHDDRGSKYYSTDFERNERQQEVIRKVADKVKSFSGITHIFGIMDIAGEHIKTDLSKSQIKGLIFAFKSIGSGSIETIPHEAYWDGVSFTVFPKENLDAIRRTLWDALGMTEAEGMALINPDNDGTPKKTVAKKGTSKNQALTTNKKESNASSGQNKKEASTNKSNTQKPSASSTDQKKQSGSDSQKQQSGTENGTQTEQPDQPNSQPPAPGQGEEQPDGQSSEQPYGDSTGGGQNPSESGDGSQSGESGATTPSDQSTDNDGQPTQP